jgi:predicted TIM-barrel fold metal-dependent hydrolase
LNRDREHAVEFLEEFSERVLFARDDFGDRHLRLLEELELARETRRRIWGENAERLVPVEGSR